MMGIQTIMMVVHQHAQMKIYFHDPQTQSEYQYEFQVEVMECLSQWLQKNEMTTTQIQVMDAVMPVKLRVLIHVQLLKVNYQFAHLYVEMEQCSVQKCEMMVTKMMILDELQTAQALLMVILELVEIMLIQHHDNQYEEITL